MLVPTNLDVSPQHHHPGRFVERRSIPAPVCLAPISDWHFGLVLSLPFTDYCQPIASDEDSFNKANQKIIEYGKHAKWRYIEWREGKHYFQETMPSVSFYSHELILENDEDSIFSKFRDSTRRNIQKAQKQGVQVDIYQSFESVKNYFHLNRQTRKAHGLPPQPFSFFRKIYRHIISKQKGIVVLASYKK